MDAYFKKLGRTVLERWNRENFSLAKFPSIACAVLEDQSPAKRVNLPALMREFLVNDEQPNQSTSPFGEPELVVYAHPRFYIQVLFWLDGSTSIHQHAFSGAFHVMRGSSIHAQWDFQNARPVTPHFMTGDLKVKKIEFLETGRTVPIISGNHCIHSLFHLDMPSVTVVVRTTHDPGTDPQFSYLPPHVAVDAFLSDNLALRRKQLLQVMQRTNDDSYLQRLLEMIGILDFERGFLILKECADHLRKTGQWEMVFSAFRKKHGRLVSGIEATLDETRRRMAIHGLRGSIAEPEHRLFLALLMNVSRRADLFALVAQRFPRKEPIETVLRWATELTDVSDSGVEILDAWFPKTLNIALEEPQVLLLASLRHFMTGETKFPAALRALSSAKLKQVRAAYAASCLSVLLD